MAGTTRANPGDVFEVPLGENKAYFQYLGKDPEGLYSHTIRIFKKRYPANSEPDLEEVVMGEPEFHAHVIIPRGIKEGHWKKVKNVKRINGEPLVIFRRSDDVGNKLNGELSRRWRVWHFNQPAEYVGDLVTEEHKRAEVAPVVPPKVIVERLETGKYQMVYPAGTENDPYISR